MSSSHKEAGKNSPKVTLLRANSFFNDGKYQEASELFEELLNSDLARMEILLSLGDAYEKLNRLDDAKNVVIQATQTNPDSVTGWMRLGGIYHQLGDLREELKCYEKSINIKKNFEDAWFKSAQVYFQLADYATAIAVLMRLTRISPTCPVYWNLLSEAYVKKGDITSSKLVLEEFNRLHLSAAAEKRRKINLGIAIRILTGIFLGVFASWFWLFVIPAIYATIEGLYCGGLAIERMEVIQTFEGAKETPEKRIEKVTYGHFFLIFSFALFYVTILLSALLTRFICLLLTKI